MVFHRLVCFIFKESSDLMMPSHTNAQSELLPLSYLSFHPRLLAAGTKGHNSFLDTIAAGPWEEESRVTIKSPMPSLGMTGIDIRVFCVIKMTLSPRSNSVQESYLSFVSLLFF